MINNKKDVTLENIKDTASNNYSKSSKEPNDGYFIEKDPMDSFSAEGTVRYGEEQDVDDL